MLTYISSFLRNEFLHLGLTQKMVISDRHIVATIVIKHITKNDLTITLKSIFGQQFIN